MEPSNSGINKFLNFSTMGIETFNTIPIEGNYTPKYSLNNNEIIFSYHYGNKNAYCGSLASNINKLVSSQFYSYVDEPDLVLSRVVNYFHDLGSVIHDLETSLCDLLPNDPLQKLDGLKLKEINQRLRKILVLLTTSELVLERLAINSSNEENEKKDANEEPHLSPRAKGYTELKLYAINLREKIDHLLANNVDKLIEDFKESEQITAPPLSPTPFGWLQSFGNVTSTVCSWSKSKAHSLVGYFHSGDDLLVKQQPDSANGMKKHTVFALHNKFKQIDFTDDDKLKHCQEVIDIGTDLDLIKFDSEKISLLDIVNDLLKLTKDSKQINELQEIQVKLNNFFIQKSSEYLKNILTSIEKEKELYQLWIETLSLQPNACETSDFDDFVENFHRLTNDKLSALDLKSLYIKDGDIIKELLAKHSYIFSVEEKDILIKSLLELIDSYKELISALKDIFIHQIQLLHNNKLILSYNYKQDQFYQNVKDDWTKAFDKEPNLYPISISNGSGGEIIIFDAHDFIARKDNFIKLKMMHEQMKACLKREFPVEIPNLLSTSTDSSLVIENEEQFKQLLDTYSSYFDQFSSVIKSLDTHINSKLNLLLKLQNLEERS